MKLNELSRPDGLKARKRRRLGRGGASGRGGTAGRGHKGQKARSGGYHKVGFEGGQMPLQRRLPKRGFTNIFRTVREIVNLDTLEGLEGVTEVTPQVLHEKGVVKKKRAEIKILARGNVTKALTVQVHACSAEAKKKIEAAGGKVEVIGG